MKGLRKITALLLCFAMFTLNIGALASAAEGEKSDLYKFDFAKFEEGTHLSAAAIEVTNGMEEKIEVFGNASATDFINPGYDIYCTANGGGNISSEGGIWWNGKSASNNRYFSFTPSQSGTIEFRVRNTYNKADGIGTAAALSYGTELGTAADKFNVAASLEYSQQSCQLLADTTYYFWPTTAGVNISTILYTPDTEAPEITSTLEATSVPEITSTPEVTLAPGVTSTPEVASQPPEGQLYSYHFEEIQNQHLAPDAYVVADVDFGEIKVSGNSSATDYINPSSSPVSAYDSVSGIWWNGKYEVSNSSGKAESRYRYMEFTPKEDGILQLTMRQSYSTPKLAYGTAPGTAVDTSSSLSSDFTTWKLKLKAGTTYYFWPTGSGVNISEFTYDTRGSKPARTNEPVPTAEPAEKPAVSPEAIITPKPKAASYIDTSFEDSDRIVMKVDDKPFFYNGIQMRIDKVTDAYGYTAGERENLFKTAAEAGFTVVNCQIRWTDIQPEIKLNAKESSYIKGGAKADTNYSSENSIVSCYSESEDEQSISYIKFDLSSLQSDYYDGTKLRIYVNKGAAAENSLRIYGITNHDWTAGELTWNNAPNHEGYEVTGEGIYDCGTTPAWDPVQKKHYYDFDVTDFINRYCLPEKTASFMLRTDYATEGSVSIDGANGTNAPQLILSKADGYDWSWLDEAVSNAQKYGLKFEVLWFGTETCSVSMDGRVPYYVHRNYQKAVKADGVPFFKKSEESSVYGMYYYLMCKNDLAMRAKEAEVVQAMFNHIAAYNQAHGNQDTVIGCQVANEPAVGRLHGSYQAPHCMCNICLEKKGNMTEQEFRDVTMWEYCNNLSTAVKESAYSVWTRVNNFGSTDASGVSYNEKMREATGTNLDFIGHDPYRETEQTIYNMGHTSTKVGNITVNYAEGKNLPVIMENSGEVDNAEALLLAGLAGGSFYNVYDICSTDGHGLYDNKKSEVGTNDIVPHGGYVDGVIKANCMVKALAPILSTLQPGSAGGKRLMYFNELSAASQTASKRLLQAGVTYTTSDAGVGIAALTDNDKSIVLASSGTAGFEVSSITEQVISVETGAYIDGEWKKTADKQYTTENGAVKIVFEPYECVKVVLSEGVQPMMEQRFEFELLAHTEQNATVNTVTESGYSGGAWSNATYSADNGYVEYTFTVDADGEYDIVLGTKDKNNRVTAQMFIDGVGIGDDIVMNASKDTPQTYNMGSCILTAGEHTIRLVATDRSRGNYGGYDYLEITEAAKIEYDYDYDLAVSEDAEGLLSVSYVYHGEAASSDTLVIAEYDTDGKLVRAETYEVEGDGIVDTKGYRRGNGTIKMFVWDGFSGMKPRSRVYTSDDIRVTEKNMLEGKRVYAFGDSIVYGHNAPDQAFMDLIEDEYGIILNKMAKNGATVIKSSKDVITQVKGAPAETPDFVVFDGYTNDAYEEVLGKIGEAKGPRATTFDNTTFCGAFEEILYTMKQKWPEARIVFITIHKSGGRDFAIQEILVEKTLEMCDAWGAEVVDMFHDSTLDTRNADEMKKYIIGGKGSHPNVAGCKEFYIPMVAGKLQALCKEVD